MRFRDYIVNEAIERNYKEKILSQSTNPLMDMIYSSLASKLGYQLITEQQESTVKITNKDWKTLIDRYGHDKDGISKRYLEYDSDNKCSYYFGENGMIYKGNGKEFTLVPILENKDIYNKYGEFLSFVSYYFETNKKSSKQYLLLGFNNKHRYYFCSDSKFYYTLEGSSSYKECTPKLVNYCYELISKLDK